MVIKHAGCLMTWFDYFFVPFVSQTFLDVMLIIHHYEAWLTILAIEIWHLSMTVFRPGVFPGNPA